MPSRHFSTSPLNILREASSRRRAAEDLCPSSGSDWTDGGDDDKGPAIGVRNGGIGFDSWAFEEIKGKEGKGSGHTASRCRRICRPWAATRLCSTRCAHRPITDKGALALGLWELTCVFFFRPSPQRNLPARGFRPGVMLGLGGLVMVYGWYKLTLGMREQQYVPGRPPRREEWKMEEQSAC